MNNIIEWINNLANNFKDFIIKYNTNPVLWIALFFIGILVFLFTYNYLNKNK